MSIISQIFMSPRCIRSLSHVGVNAEASHAWSAKPYNPDGGLGVAGNHELGDAE